jgi:hypothetical protein
MRLANVRFQGHQSLITNQFSVFLSGLAEKILSWQKRFCFGRTKSFLTRKSFVFAGQNLFFGKNVLF